VLQVLWYKRWLCVDGLVMVGVVYWRWCVLHVGIKGETYE
jgi:hypothetical protein